MKTTENTEKQAVTFRALSISQLAILIQRDWRQVNFGAKPYLVAMLTLESVNDSYGWDSGKSIVAYFLSNASTYRGEIAREIKKELKTRIK